MMRSLVWGVAVAVMILAGTGGAQAIDAKKQEKLSGYFAGLGTVQYELYAPLGGPDVGGAIIDAGDGTGRLYIARQGKSGTEELVTETLPQLSQTPVFTFLLTGLHALVYPTRDWVAPNGEVHQRGDLKIYDVTTEEKAVLLYELKDVCDISFQAGGGMSNDSLIWQPANHFANKSGLLPVKNNYFQLSFDPEKKEYYLRQHLTALPDAGTVDSANLNNRALFYYHENQLQEASRLLRQADEVSQTNQSVILRNRALINSEIGDIASQAQLLPGRPSDEALQYFWQGDYLGVLRVMDARGRTGFTDYESAVLALALAYEERWPEVDGITAELERRGTPFLADYLWELVKIADGQDHRDIAEVRLMALESVDNRHPGYIVGLSRLLRSINETDQARQILEHYVNDPANVLRCREPRYELFELYYRSANSVGCDRLIQDALQPPILDLKDYVLMVDYTDLSSAMSSIPMDSSGRLLMPKEPLETFSIE